DLTCPPGKKLNPCGDSCQVTCKDVTTNNVHKVCPRKCKQPACVCPRGQALIRGQCVAYDHCWRLPPEDQDFHITIHTFCKKTSKPVKPLDLVRGRDCGDSQEPWTL
uniref:TIL domain-containing protein n=1 Tax=Romanomermis culicivorax TaxID=13658 RepID=A0A915IRD0_ROMCU